MRKKRKPQTKPRKKTSLLSADIRIIYLGLIALFLGLLLTVMKTQSDNAQAATINLRQNCTSMPSCMIGSHPTCYLPTPVNGWCQITH